MPRELLILRHAKSDWDAGAAADFDRPLTRRGKRDAPKIGAWLAREGLVPDTVISSPARRARQTAARVCKALAIDKAQIRWEATIYEATLAGLLAVLEGCPAEASRVLLVGHNPGLENLLLHLCGAGLDLPDDGKLLPTGSLAWLELPADWASLEAGSVQLISLIRPRDL